MTSRQVFNQINRLTADFISTGLCDDQNFPSLTPGVDGFEEVSIGNIKSTAFLKNISYRDMYAILKSKRFYNFQMIDGALILLQYRFLAKKIVTHRLSFFPSPDLAEFQNSPELYMADEIYADILDKRVVTVPLRFDFDNRQDVPSPKDHPISHLTIGQYENCRIPVTSAITPYHFLSFLLNNFYHTATLKFGNKLSYFDDKFCKEIFDEDTMGIYINSPHTI